MTGYFNKLYIEGGKTRLRIGCNWLKEKEKESSNPAYQPGQGDVWSVF